MNTTLFWGNEVQEQWKLWHSLMANTFEKLRAWKQSLKAFNSCRQAQSIMALWSCVRCEEHRWKLNAIILCKWHGRRVHIVKLFCLKYNFYESHHLLIIIQVDTTDHYIIEIKLKCYLWVGQLEYTLNILPVIFMSLLAKATAEKTDCN